MPSHRKVSFVVISFTQLERIFCFKCSCFFLIVEKNLEEKSADSPCQVLLVGLHGHPHPRESRNLGISEESGSRSALDAAVLDDVLLRQVLGRLDRRHHSFDSQKCGLEVKEVNVEFNQLFR